jgi:hypothetical protein
MTQASFPALIKELKIYTTVDLDKEARITLRFRPTDELIDGLNRLMRGDQEIMAAIVEIDETSRKYTSKHKNGKKQVSERQSGQTEGGEV